MVAPFVKTLLSRSYLCDSFDPHTPLTQTYHSSRGCVIPKAGST